MPKLFVYIVSSLYFFIVFANSEHPTKDLGQEATQLIQEAIHNQFNHYRANGIDHQFIDDLHNLSPVAKHQIAFVRVQIVDNRIYAEHYLDLSNGSNTTNTNGSVNIYNMLISGLQRIVKKHPIKNIDFIFLANDNLQPLQEIAQLVLNKPIFLMSKNLSSLVEKNKLLLPDAYLLSNKVWPKLVSKISHAATTYPWDAKNSEKIFWRGSSTGGEFDIDNYDKLKRLSLVMMAKSFPDKIDAAFTSYTQFADNQKGKDLLVILEKLYGDSKQYSLKPSKHLEYKYLISLDGNTCAWGRVPWILLSNSVLLKQETDFVEIFYPALKPFVHYIPVKEDLSDVFEKLNWLQNNDQKAKEISKNATKFICDNLMPSDVDEYTAQILNEYHDLQRFKIDRPSLPLIQDMFF